MVTYVKEGHIAPIVVIAEEREYENMLVQQAARRWPGQVMNHSSFPKGEPVSGAIIFSHMGILSTEKQRVLHDLLNKNTPILIFRAGGRRLTRVLNQKDNVKHCLFEQATWKKKIEAFLQKVITRQPAPVIVIAKGEHEDAILQCVGNQLPGQAMVYPLYPIRDKPVSAAIVVDAIAPSQRQALKDLIEKNVPILIFQSNRRKPDQEIVELTEGNKMVRHFFLRHDWRKRVRSFLQTTTIKV